MCQVAGGLELDPGLVSGEHGGLVRLHLLAGQLHVEAICIGMTLLGGQ
jgi:hypothetical protein